MPWIRLDDQFPDHPKTVAAGPAAAWLFVCGIGYCNRLLTDGVIPTGQVRKLADVDNAMELAGKLVEVGLWEAVEGGYRVHDFLEYQPSAEQVKAERAGNAQRQQEWRERNKGRNAVTNTVTDTVSNAPRNGTVTPAPYPPRTRTQPRTETLPDQGETPPLPPTPIRPPAEPVAPPDGGERANDPKSLPAIHATRFEAFWREYPKKVGRKSCEAWWGKRRPDAELTQTILDSIAAHRHGDQWQRNFIKDPIRWLQEERWNDEISAPAIPSQASGRGTAVLLDSGQMVSPDAARKLHKFANIDLGVKQC